MGRTRYNQFEADIVNPALNSFCSGVINDVDIRKLFLQHTQEIFDSYQEKGLRLGRMSQYIASIMIVNEFLDEKKVSQLSYFSLLEIGRQYIFKKMRNQQFTFPGELGRAVAIAKQDDPTLEGKQHLLQISCEAERDFLLLINRYIEFFLFSGECKATFDSNAIRLGLLIPGLHYLVKRKLTKFNGYLEKFEARDNYSSTACIRSSITSTSEVTLNVSSSQMLTTVSVCRSTPLVVNKQSSNSVDTDDKVTTYSSLTNKL